MVTKDVECVNFIDGMNNIDRTQKDHELCFYTSGFNSKNKHFKDHFQQ